MTSATSIPSFGTPAPSRLQRVRSALEAMGLEPALDDDGDLKVAVQGQQLYLRVSDDGPGLLRAFGQWQIVPGLADDPGVRFGAAHHVTANHALVKLNIMDDTLVVAVDCLVPEPTRYDVIVPAAVEALMSGVGMWHQLVADHAKGQTEGGAPDQDASSTDTPQEGAAGQPTEPQV